MAEVKNELQILRGNDSAFQSVSLKEGEPAFVLDTKKLYIGGQGGGEKVLINPDVLGPDGKIPVSKLPTGEGQGDIPVIGPEGKLPIGTLPTGPDGKLPIEVIPTGTTPNTVPIIGPDSKIPDSVIPDDIPRIAEDGKLDPGIIPSLALTEVFPVANEEERLALSQAHVGDVAYQEDTGETFMLLGLPASENQNWTPISGIKAPVTSVNGKTGAVVLGLGDISGLEGALNSKANVGGATFVGPVSAPTPSTSDNSTNVATTAFVKQAIEQEIGEIDYPVKSVNGLTGQVVLNGGNLDITGYTEAIIAGKISPLDTINVALGKLEYRTDHIDCGTF